MRNRVEVLRHVGINDIGVAPADQPVHFLDRVGRTATGPVAIPGFDTKLVVGPVAES